MVDSDVSLLRLEVEGRFCGGTPACENSREEDPRPKQVHEQFDRLIPRVVWKRLSGRQDLLSQSVRAIMEIQWYLLVPSLQAVQDCETRDLVLATTLQQILCSGLVR